MSHQGGLDPLGRLGRPRTRQVAPFGTDGDEVDERVTAARLRFGVLLAVPRRVEAATGIAQLARASTDVVPDRLDRLGVLLGQLASVPGRLDERMRVAALPHAVDDVVEPRIPVVGGDVG